MFSSGSPAQPVEKDETLLGRLGRSAPAAVVSGRIENGLLGSCREL